MRTRNRAPIGTRRAFGMSGSWSGERGSVALRYRWHPRRLLGQIFPPKRRRDGLVRRQSGIYEGGWKLLDVLAAGRRVRGHGLLSRCGGKGRKPVLPKVFLPGLQSWFLGREVWMLVRSRCARVRNSFVEENWTTFDGRNAGAGIVARANGGYRVVVL